MNYCCWKFTSLFCRANLISDKTVVQWKADANIVFQSGKHRIIFSKDTEVYKCLLFLGKQVWKRLGYCSPTVRFTACPLPLGLGGAADTKISGCRVQMLCILDCSRRLQYCPVCLNLIAANTKCNGVKRRAGANLAMEYGFGFPKARKSLNVGPLKESSFRST